MKDMERLEKPLLAEIDSSVTHQGIGGKTIVIEREGTISWVLDRPLNEITIGLSNFIHRYDINSVPEDTRIFYGHVGTLGYFVAEDELIDIREAEWPDVYDYLND